MSKKPKVRETKGIVVATPAYGGQLTVSYVNSLIRSQVLFQQYGIQIHVMFLCNHSLITMARNRIVAEIFRQDKHDWDSIVWIDADISWEPEDLLKMCLHDEDVVCGTYRKKIHQACHFTMKLIPGQEEPDERGLIEVEAVGTGFLRVSRNAMQNLLSNEEVSYTEKVTQVEFANSNMEIKNLFESGIKNGEMLSEDFFFCAKLREHGYKIMLDTKIDLGHDGSFTYRGSLSHYLNFLKEEKAKTESSYLDFLQEQKDKADSESKVD
jgi:hypothetical protein